MPNKFELDQACVAGEEEEELVVRTWATPQRVASIVLIVLPL